MSKIKVGFEITDSWNNGGFREFITSISKDERYELYIISNDDSSAFINSVGIILGLPTTQVYVVNFTQDKLDKIDALGIQIYFENLKYVADQIENTTMAYGIYVNILPVKFYAQPTYVVDFERLVNGIDGNTCEEFKAKED